MDYIEEQGISVVANGAFNPSIFHPSWLCRHGLITPDEEDAAAVEICHAEISQFSIPGMKFDIQTERASINGLAEPLIRTAEMFAEIFQNLLPHTPIKTAGINYWAHFSTKDWAQRQRFARSLAPVEPWGEFGALMESEDKKQAGGFSTLSMRANYLEYGENGSINVHVQPSVKVPNDAGVFVAINHHFSELSNENAGDTILAKYDDCVRYSRRLINYLIERARDS